MFATFFTKFKSPQENREMWQSYNLIQKQHMIKLIQFNNSQNTKMFCKKQENHLCIYLSTLDSIDFIKYKIIQEAIRSTIGYNTNCPSISKYNKIAII